MSTILFNKLKTIIPATNNFNPISSASDIVPTQEYATYFDPNPIMVKTENDDYLTIEELELLLKENLSVSCYSYL